MGAVCACLNTGGRLHRGSTGPRTRPQSTCTGLEGRVQRIIAAPHRNEPSAEGLDLSGMHGHGRYTRTVSHERVLHQSNN